MIKITFTNNQVEDLQEILHNHPHQHVRSKALALLLTHNKVEFNKILEIVGICENTLRTYYKHYLDAGIDAIKALNFRKPSSKLSSFKEIIKEYLTESPPSFD